MSLEVLKNFDDDDADDKLNREEEPRAVREVRTYLLSEESWKPRAKC